MIYVLTGSIRSGKTTALKNWISTRTDVDGLLCPDDINGKRVFLKVKQKATFKLETEDEAEALENIGNFKFLKSSFDHANSFLITLNNNQENKYVVIDEIGKLELKNKGLHLSAETMIPEFLNNENNHLILIVRDYLVEDVLIKYDISQYIILKKEDLESLS